MSSKIIPHRSHFHFIVQSLHKWSKSSVWGFEEYKTFVKLIKSKTWNKAIPELIQVLMTLNVIGVGSAHSITTTYYTLNTNTNGCCMSRWINQSASTFLRINWRQVVCSASNVTKFAAKFVYLKSGAGLSLYMQGVTKGWFSWHFGSNVQTARSANSKVHNTMAFTNLLIYNIIWILESKNETRLSNMIQPSN